LGLRGLATYLGVALVVAGPYTLYTALAFPASYAVESRNWRVAFFSNYENWGRPLDYHLTAYLYALYGPALALLLAVATITLALVALRSRSRADVLVVAWIAVFYVPLTLAVTKAVPMTIAVVPAFGLAAARLICLGLASRSLARRALTLGLLLGAAGSALWFLAGNLPQISGAVFGAYIDNTPVPFRPEVLHTSIRMLPYPLEIGVALVAAALCAGGMWLARRVCSAQGPDEPDAATPRAGTFTLSRLLSRGEPIGIALVLGVSILTLGATWLRYDWAVVGRPADNPGPMPALGKLVAQQTPANATVLFYDTQSLQYNANFVLEFWAHRDVYPADTFSGTTVCSLMRTAAEHGSPLYVLTREPYSGSSFGSAAGWTLYTPACAARP
ncbi:MAG TPA: hypothetical protein VGS80_12175, partial [Ktedonobacterales bacterium]|nr:hypothetical protein [Ktedonobacterales bacterium]